jgi:hypothetical protein
MKGNSLNMAKIRAHAFYKSIKNTRPDNLVITPLGANKINFSVNF